MDSDFGWVFQNAWKSLRFFESQKNDFKFSFISWEGLHVQLTKTELIQLFELN